MKKTIILFITVIISFNAIAQIQEGTLYDACESGNYDVVEQYISEGGDINIDFENGETPLMTACRFNHSDVIELFVEAGVKLNLVNFNGMTAMSLLRLQMGFNDTFNSDFQTSLRDMYAYLMSKGGKEQDYVKLIAENKNGKYDEEQMIVLQIKNDFKAYKSNSKNYKTKIYNDHKYEGDDMSFTDHKNNYIANYGQSGELVFFQHKNTSIAEWHDNASRDGFDRQYYFKNGKLYFYFDTNYSGPTELDYQQIRYYFNEDKIIVAAVKRYDEWWESMKEDKDKFNFKNIVNLKDTEIYPETDEKARKILDEFETNYNDIKHLLK